MDTDKRKVALEKLADHFEVNPSDPNTAAEDLGAYLDDPTTIHRWVAVTRSDEMDIHYLVADFDDEAAAREYAMRFVEDPLFAEQPVLVFDLDRGREVRCGSDVSWTEEVTSFGSGAGSAPEGNEKVDETDVAAYVGEAMRGRLETLKALQVVIDEEGRNLAEPDAAAAELGIDPADVDGDGADLVEAAETALQELPLCVEATTTFEIVLGTGGPDDRFLIYVEGDQESWEITRIEYRYSWSGSAERTLGGDDYELVERFARRVVPELIE